jgi:ABC-2 type transport system permease protein
MWQQVWTLCRQELRLWVQRVDHWAVLFLVPMVLISVFQAHISGFSLTFVFFLVPNLAATVVDEREVGTLRRLLATPASRGAILLGKVLPYFLLAMVQLVVLFSVCHAAFDVEMGGAPLALGAVMVCAAASVAGLGIMSAAVAKTKAQAGSVPTIVIIAMAIVSGCVVPYIAVPGIKCATPHYWALLGFENVMVRGMGFSGVLLPCGVLLAFAAAFLVIGVWRFRFGRE